MLDSDDKNNDENSTINLSTESVNDIFKIPITYNENNKQLNQSVINDLELVDTVDVEEKPIYEHIFNTTDSISRQVVKQIASNYTTDTDFLTQTQDLVSVIETNEINTIFNKYNFSSFDFDNIVNSWQEIYRQTGFCEKYLYIDWNFAKFLNNNTHFLQLMSIYNIASPVLSLLLPIFILIMPFFIIKAKGININIKDYIDVLKALISNHAITKIFTQFHQVDFNQKIYLIVSAAFYLFSVYQNILVCVRFYSNMKKIHDYLFKFKDYIDFSLETMEYYITKTKTFSKYTNFNNELTKNMNVLYDFKTQINKITPFSLSLFKISEIGHIMHTFYQLYDNNYYTNSLLYSFGFHSYFNIMKTLKNNVETNKLYKTTYTQKGRLVLKKMYYPKLIHASSESIVKNDCNLNKNMIITGPNASGKTTTIKTCLINVILSQQFGYGCFESCKLTPFENIHSYLNIPDTSGRDSLFQAEARRCKEIIDSVEKSSTENHICIFDELYSGTNPEEAVSSAFALMNYLVNKENVTCILTTHYVKLCKKLGKNNKIKNYNMKTLKKNDNFEYTYILQNGISKIKGGLKVLKDMNYPKEILESTRK